MLRPKSTIGKQLGVDHLIDEETLTGFNPSLYLPVKVGDTIDGRYQIKCKLGFGGGSTTWLCIDKDSLRHDSQASDAHNHGDDDFKVLKITTHRTTQSSSEAKIHDVLRQTQPDHSGRYCVRRAERSFSVTSGSKLHDCFVFAPLGPSLLDFVRERTAPLSSTEVRWIAIYLLHAVDFIHASGVVHTGESV